MMDIKHELATINLVLKVAFTEIDFKALRLDVRLLTMDFLLSMICSFQRMLKAEAQKFFSLNHSY